MKKIIYGGTTVLAIAIAVVLNMNLSTERSYASDIFLANVEALAQSETSDYDCCKPYTEECAIEGDVLIPGVQKKKGGC